ncbi:MAG: MarR family transcriptional regulator [Pseudomonadota bacterium]
MTMPLDSETRIKDDDHLALKLWLRLLTCTNLVEGALRQNLRQTFDSTLPRFDLLAQLDKHPEKLTMGELSRLMMVSGGNVTGLVRQMEEEGLVNRVPMKSDRRTFQVGLTAKGKRHFDQMAVEHEKWVASLFEQLDHGEQEVLMASLSALKASVSKQQLRS